MAERDMQIAEPGTKLLSNKTVSRHISKQIQANANLYIYTCMYTYKGRSLVYVHTNKLTTVNALTTTTAKK